MHFKRKHLLTAAGLRVPGSHEVANRTISSTNTVADAGSNGSAEHVAANCCSEHVAANCCTEHIAAHCCADSGADSANSSADSNADASTGVLRDM